jgi:hypothetical protein
LRHLETNRGNTASARNARPAAIHSFFRYAVVRVPNTPTRAGDPLERFDHAIVNFLTRSETDALIAHSGQDHLGPGGVPTPWSPPRGGSPAARWAKSARKMVSVTRFGSTVDCGVLWGARAGRFRLHAGGHGRGPVGRRRPGPHHHPGSENALFEFACDHNIIPLEYATPPLFTHRIVLIGGAGRPVAVKVWWSGSIRTQGHGPRFVAQWPRDRHRVCATPRVSHRDILRMAGQSSPGANTVALWSSWGRTWPAMDGADIERDRGRRLERGGR